MNEQQRKRWAALTADRCHINRAAAMLREQAWLGQYAGLEEKDRCIALAALLDTLSLQLDRLPPGVRHETVLASRWLVEGSRAVTTRQ